MHFCVFFCILVLVEEISTSGPPTVRNSKPTRSKNRSTMSPNSNSSTLATVSLYTGPDPDDNLENTTVDDRYLINAPRVCPDGQKLTSDNKCRKVFS